MYPHEHEVHERAFNGYTDWKEFYRDVVEEYPPNILERMGKPVIIMAFFDDDNSSNVVTRMSHTGIPIFYKQYFDSVI